MKKTPGADMLMHCLVPALNAWEEVPRKVADCKEESQSRPAAPFRGNEVSVPWGQGLPFASFRVFTRVYVLLAGFWL